ncbi:MAG: hypothetical protein A2722_04110 [Candidatus Doudnabacteria bacterium RIFCSPHIGHO2_01_FULL_50_11]|uniref:DUF305 domain-containing protein n=1 Tax=Candidatus Doudnabacteria bacterium RIFCSPHIGHO2_01_FULL_50_11 TaxID=1817828 RepID=A0A1F5PFF2_9BACT|nr:MAG: hypothetical protein A2722_04110 [Candidatus Doudnabacteria bacterium RIFCSPHIGHO2_01_FULL_50_11]
MDNKNILYGIIGLLAGIILAWVFASTAVNNQNAGMMSMMGMTATNGMMGNLNMMDDHHDDDQNMSGVMEDMMSGLENKTGDEFDRAFIDEMTVHHEGAIDMANEALRNAKHQEIKSMANDIISAQSKEIIQMKEWREQWYK